MSIAANFVATIGQDVRQAFRALSHSRGFAAWVAGSLAVGMAVTITTLAFLNALLFRPFPAVTDQERLVRVSVSRGCEGPGCRVRMSSAADYAAFQEGLTGLQGLAAYAQGQLAVALPAARSMRGVLASENYFDVLGVRPALGRSFHASDRGSHAAVAVIAHRVWAREFDADPSVIGRSIRVADEFVEIIGVAPEFFVGIDLRPARGDRGPDIWLPLWLADRVSPLTRAEQRRRERDMYFVGRLREGFEAADVQAEAEVVALRFTAARDQRAPDALAVVQRVSMGNPDHRPITVGVVLPIPILVMVIACVNAANLMLARGSERQREMVIRLAIGAGRGRIIRQLLIESAVLALAATGVALPVAWCGLQLAGTPLSIPVPIDGTVLGLAVLTAGLTTAAFGSMPAVRISAAQPSSTLGRVGAGRDASPPQSRLRRLLVVAQVALSLGLMGTAWQFASTVRSQAVSAGTPADRLLIARFDLQPFFPDGADTDGFYRSLVDGAVRLPGVEAAGLARHTSVWTFGQGTASGSILVWLPQDGPDEERVTIGGYAGGDLFQALGLRTLAGRGFADGDRQPRPQVALVNDAFARSLQTSPLGAVLRVAPRGRAFGSSMEVRVVGVIEPTLEPRLTPGEPPAPKVYLPSPLEAEPALALYLRTRGPAATLAQPVREVASRVAPRVPVLDVGSLEELNERSYGPQLWLARAAGLFGVIGLLLATAGLYSVTSYLVVMRSREMAIRIAVGASRRAILRMVLGQSMGLALYGLMAGGGASLAVSRLVQSEYHGIQRIDWTAFSGSAGLFVAAMLLASLIPAARASRVDPVETLKDS
jgi:predicted permease